MNIKFEGKDNTMFNDVIFSWYVSSSVNDYRISITFCGGIDEDGNEDLYASFLADIDITEIKHHDHDILNEVYELLKNDIECEFYDDTIMITCPDIRETLTTRNESSYGDTLDDFNKMQSALINTILKHENNDIFADLD